MSSVDIQFLLYVSQQIIIYCGLSILILGLIGNFFNILVFISLKTFRENSCAFYLTIQSILNFAQLIFGLLTHVMINGFGIDWTQSSLFYCKFRRFLFQTTSFISFACISLAIVDQYFATCTNLRWRQWSNHKTAYRLILLASFLLVIMQIPALIYYDHFRSTTATTETITCTAKDASFLIYSTYFGYLVLANIIPCAIQCLFGIMAYRNIQQIPYRTVPLVRRDLDKQLTIMVLLQVVWNFITLVPNLIVYILMIYGNIQDVFIKAQVNVAYAVSLSLYYLYFASPFYIYIIVSERFRRQLLYVLSKMYWYERRPQQIFPEQTAPQLQMIHMTMT